MLNKQKNIPNGSPKKSDIRNQVDRLMNAYLQERLTTGVLKMSLDKIGVSDEVISRWGNELDSSHRHYHNLNHVESILYNYIKRKGNVFMYTIRGTQLQYTKKLPIML